MKTILLKLIEHYGNLKVAEGEAKANHDKEIKAIANDLANAKFETIKAFISGLIDPTA